MNNWTASKTSIRLQEQPQTTKARTPTPRLHPSKKSVLKIISSAPKWSKAMENQAARPASDYKSSIRASSPEPQPQDPAPTRSRRETSIRLQDQPRNAKDRPPTPRLNPNKKSLLKISLSGGRWSEAVRNRTTRLVSDYKCSLRPPRPKH